MSASPNAELMGFLKRIEMDQFAQDIADATGVCDLQDLLDTVLAEDDLSELRETRMKKLQIRKLYNKLMDEKASKSRSKSFQIQQYEPNASSMVPFSQSLPRTLKPLDDQAKIIDRVAGAILGVFIGDALAMGVHWQYDLDKLEADRGYVTDYLTPLAGTYHAGCLTAGQLEVQGACDKILLQSLATCHGLDQEDYLSRFEAVILRDPKLNGTRQGGRYGWTDKIILDFWKKRVQAGLPWEQCVSPRCDTPDPAVRGALLAGRYHASPYELCVQVNKHAKAQTDDSSIHQHSVGFALLVAGLIEGQPLDGDLGHKLYEQCGTVLPFSSMHSAKDHDERYGVYSEPDSLDFISSIWKGVGGIDKKFKFEADPPHRGVQMYGQACAFWECLASAYYCVALFPDDFEKAILCSVNGGGSNTVRSSLVGALLGASCGLSGIIERSPRFLTGLDDSNQLIAWAKQVAQDSLHGIDGDKWQWPAAKPEAGDWSVV